MRSQRSREGYLLIDNQASPGVSADLVRASGKEAPIVGEGKLFEAATLSCGHCQRTVIKNPDRERDRAHCFRCHHYVCDACAALGECRPIAKTLDQLGEAAIRNLLLEK